MTNIDFRGQCHAIRNAALEAETAAHHLALYAELMADRGDDTYVLDIFGLDDATQALAGLAYEVERNSGLAEATAQKLNAAVKQKVEDNVARKTDILNLRTDYKPNMENKNAA